MRHWLTLLWDLRRSPDRRVRVVWYLTAAAPALVSLVLPDVRIIVILVAAALSVLYSFTAVVWGAFHPRRLLPAVQVVWKWAAWLTVITGISLYAGGLELATRFLAVSVPTVAVWFVLLVLLPALFLFFLGYGCLGAIVSAFTARRWPERQRLTRGGAIAWWLFTLVSLVAIRTTWSANNPGKTAILLFVIAPLLAIPLFTVILCILARNPERGPRRAGERLLQRLSRYLTFRRRWRKHLIEIDLRGAVIGLIVGVVVFCLLRPILKAPSTSLLVSMIQMRDQEAQGAWSGSDIGAGVAGYIQSLGHEDKEILAMRQHVALVDLDTPVLREAFAPPLPAATALPKAKGKAAEMAVHSEAGLDALLIKRLKALGAAVIVLFPTEDGLALPAAVRTALETARDAETKIKQALPDDPEVKAAFKEVDEKRRSAVQARLAREEADKDEKAQRQQSLQDESDLEKAVRDAGNVALVLPGEEHSFHSRLQAQIKKRGPVAPKLIEAARTSAAEDLVSYGSVRLPVLQEEDPKKPSLPLLLARSYDPAPKSKVGYGFPAHSLIPVDFQNAKPDHDFLHIPASTLVMPPSAATNGDARILTPNGHWLNLDVSVRGRIVFLDTRSTDTRETPIGTLPTREVLAYATATVLAREKGLRVATSRCLLLTLLVATVMGALCAHRTPFEAAGRLLGLSALLLFASLLCYIGWTLWLDAVVPLVAIVLTYLLVTQLAFTQQREKERDLLKRFVAPEFVDSMLDHPSDSLGLSGKLSHICVLFADVRNFTGFAERHRPEEVFEAVNQYMTALTDALHTYGGVLDKYTGDGLMAWFPSEANSRRQIEKAVKASLAMRDAALAVSRTRIAQGKPALDFGIGMHYGEAMIGLVGNEEHQINYTALGHAVIVSARLQTLAAGGEVIISEAIFTALDSTFEVEARDPVAVKGIYELVRPYLVRSA